MTTAAWHQPDPPADTGNLRRFTRCGACSDQTSYQQSIHSHPSAGSPKPSLATIRPACARAPTPRIPDGRHRANLRSTGNRPRTGMHLGCSIGLAVGESAMGVRRGASRRPRRAEYRSTSWPTTRTPGAQGSATLLGGGPVGTARRRVVSVAEGVTGPDLPERVELVRAALPGSTAAGSSRSWTRRWTRRDRPGTCGRLARLSRPGVGWCWPAGTAGRGGQQPRRGWAAAKRPCGRPNRSRSRTRSAAI
jgi:hypothetical protein